MQELRRGRVALLTNLKLGYWSLWRGQYSMVPCDRRSMVDMTDIPQAYWQLDGNVESGKCRQAFSYMFEGFSGTWYGGGASPAIQWPKWLANFFIPFLCFRVFFPVLYFSASVSFSFKRICTFPFLLTDSLFLW